MTNGKRPFEVLFLTNFSDSCFKAIPALSSDVCERMAEVAPRSEVRPLGVEPANGAVTLALAAARGTLALPSYF